MLKQSLTYALASIVEEGIGTADRLFRQRFGWDVRELRVLRLVRDTPGITFTALAQALVANHNKRDSPADPAKTPECKSSRRPHGQSGAEGATAPETLRHKKPRTG